MTWPIIYRSSDRRGLLGGIPAMRKCHGQRLYEGQQPAPQRGYRMMIERNVWGVVQGFMHLKGHCTGFFVVVDEEFSQHKWQCYFFAANGGGDGGRRRRHLH